MFFSTTTTIFKIASYFLFLSIIPNLHAQNSYKVVYDIEPILQGSLENRSKSTTDLVKKILDYAENMNYTLLVNQEESFFEEQEVLTKGAPGPLEDIYLKAARGFTNFNEKTYTNYKTDSVVYVKNLLNKNFVIKRSFYDFNWDIKDVRKNMLGFESRKAVGTYYDPITGEELKVEAWFIPAIPMQAGPDIFMGLPGLIVEVHLKKTVVKAKQIRQEGDLDIEKPNEEKAISQKEFEDLLPRLRGKFLDN